MSNSGVDNVTAEEKEKMRKLLESATEPLTVQEIINNEENEFEQKSHTVSVLHALIAEGVATHNIGREYTLTTKK